MVRRKPPDVGAAQHDDRDAAAGSDPGEYRARPGPRRKPAGVTLPGSSSFLVRASLVSAGLLRWRDRRWRRAAAVVVTMAGSLVLTVAVKTAVGRVRPPARPPAAGVVGRASTGCAFPSGHTLNNAVFAGLVCWVVPLRNPRGSVGASSRSRPGRPRARRDLSHVVLGCHWPSDVVGGWLLATARLAAASRFTDRLSPRSDPAHPELPPAAGPRADRPAEGSGIRLR